MLGRRTLLGGLIGTAALGMPSRAQDSVPGADAAEAATLPVRPEICTSDRAATARAGVTLRLCSRP